MTDARSLEEGVLRDAVLRGSEEAWRLLHARSAVAARARVHRILGDRAGDLADEALQETWLVAVRRIRSFDPERAPFAIWMDGIARNVAREAVARWSRERGAPDDGRPFVAPDAGEELGDQVAVAMAGLPDRYRAVLTAKYRQSRSVADIATAWGVTAKSVESLLGRARSAFRSAWNDLERESER